MNSKNKNLYSLVITAVLLAIGMVLPFITGQIQAIAKIISPLHIPVLICGLCCGWKWGLGLGIILPLLRGLIFGIPVFPTSALPMAFELATYGLLTGLIYMTLLKLLKLKNRLPAMMIALITAMIIGRFVGGAAKALLISVGIIGTKDPFTFSAFFTSYFVSTAPGALIHLVVVPAVVMAVERMRMSPVIFEWIMSRSNTKNDL